MPIEIRLSAPLRLLCVLAFCVALPLTVSSCARRSPTTPVGSLRTGDLRSASEVENVDDAEGEVMVTLMPGVDPNQFGMEYGIELDQSNGSGSATYRPAPGESAEALAARLRSDPRVVSSERNGYLETAESRQQSFAFDDGRGSPQACAAQPSMGVLGMNTAHLASRGHGVLVAILDTGGELTHPALAGRVAGGWDFIAGDSDPTDEPDGLDNDGDGRVDEARGHGTHVAGIVAQTAPEAGLLIVRVLDADGRGDILSVASGIEWALDHGARVINLSLGMLRPSQVIEGLLAEAEQRGVVCVTSAGNWGADYPVEFPASSSHALAVAAVDTEGRAASFTSHGSFVALSAPGVEIRSAYFGGRYALWSGTSMSAPFVSGTSALLLALHPLWNRRMVLDRLGATSYLIDGLNPAIAGELGAGALDAAAALVPDLPDVPPADPGPVPARRLPPPRDHLRGL